jgi:type VI secretion system protein ImpA
LERLERNSTRWRRRQSPVIDVDALLAPIRWRCGSGADLRYEGTYDRIKEARRADDALAQGDWKRDLKTAEWQKVIDLATVAPKKTKDLQIGAWLAEALISATEARPGLQV